VARNEKRLLAAGLDAGGAYSRTVILAFEDGHLRYLGHGESPARGWTRGRVTDAAAIADSIQLSVRAAERIAHQPIDSVVAGVGGATTQGFVSRGVYEFGRPRLIGQDDLNYAVQLACRVRLEDDRYVLQILPVDFTLDGRAGFRNPIGVACSRLEANVFVITCSAREHQALVSAFHKARLALDETMFEPLAAAYACILPEDRARGVALLDIGAHGSTLAIYDGDSLAHIAGLPIGGDHFTRDLAQLLRLHYEDAEQLKQEFGCAILGLTSDSTLIELPSPEGRQAREASRRHLNEILEARAEELFLRVRDDLAHSNMERSLLEGIVLTGGGAHLNGMCDVAEAVLNCQARNGLVMGVEDWPEDLDQPCWAVAAGLAMFSARVKSRREPKRRVPSLVGLVLK
jgi:cell division protein FtsA